MLQIDPDKVCWLVVKAREFDAKVEPEGDYDGSNPTDDRDMAVLEDHADDPTLEEITTFLKDLNDDEMDELLALLWIGRGDFGSDEWQAALAAARDAKEARRPSYFLGIPILGDYLEDALSQFGHSCEDFEMGHL